MSEGAYGEQALELLGKFFENAGIKATKIETEPAYSIVLGGDHGLMPAMAGLLMDRHQFVTYVAAPSTCPADRRAAVAEFVARANWGLPMGNFELDIDDGSVRFNPGNGAQHLRSRSVHDGPVSGRSTLCYVRDQAT
jgi:hypothetical protein